MEGRGWDGEKMTMMVIMVMDVVTTRKMIVAMVLMITCDVDDIDDGGVCLFVGCLTSQQQASVSQGRICSDNFTCCHTEVEVADQTLYLTQSQYMMVTMAMMVPTMMIMMMIRIIWKL